MFLHEKIMNWFLYDIGLRRERIKILKAENNKKRLFSKLKTEVAASAHEFQTDIQIISSFSNVTLDVSFTPIM